MEQDQKFVEDIVKSIVGNPDKVKTERTVDEMGVLITLHADASDMGYIIGRSGQTARAIRTLLKIVGAKNNARVNLKIIEPEGSEKRERPPRRDDFRRDDSRRDDSRRDDSRRDDSRRDDSRRAPASDDVVDDLKL